MLTEWKTSFNCKKLIFSFKANFVEDCSRQHPSMYNYNGSTIELISEL